MSCRTYATYTWRNSTGVVALIILFCSHCRAVTSVQRVKCNHVIFYFTSVAPSSLKLRENQKVFMSFLYCFFFPFDSCLNFMQANTSSVLY